MKEIVEEVIEDVVEGRRCSAAFGKVEERRFSAALEAAIDRALAPVLSAVIIRTIEPYEIHAPDSTPRALFMIRVHPRNPR